MAASLSATPTLAQPSSAAETTVKLLSDGRILVDGKPTDMAAVEARFQAEQKSGVKTSLILLTDPDVSYERITTFLNMARRYDRVKVGLVTGKAN